MLNKEYISDSMKCENQEPVEVVLVFNERKRQVLHTQHRPKRLGHLTQKGIFFYRADFCPQIELE